MTFPGAFFHGLTLAALSLLASMAGVLSPSAPAASFTASTANPAAGCLVLFTDTSTGSPTTWTWDFGDGTPPAGDRSPGHVFAVPGSYTVRLTAGNGTGSASATLAVTVTSDGVLRLNAAHPFDLTLTARDPRTGSTGAGKVIGQNDVYGYFSLPSLSGNAGNPEIIVKMVDATGIGANYWVFYGTMTDLEYDLAVTEVGTGVVKHYRKSANTPSGQFDTTGFLGPQPTPTPTSPSAPTPTPTVTPGSAQPLEIDVDVQRYAYSPGSSAPIQVTAGVPTTLVFSTSDVTHGFSGVADLGIAGTNRISPGGDSDPYGGGNPNPIIYRVTFTAPLSQRGKTFSFHCTATPECGPFHSTMVGFLKVN
ncbi:MAG: PKD domain-containing protein [Acidobacteriota bacterium]